MQQDPGLTTRNKKLLGAPGIATRSKDATNGASAAGSYWVTNIYFRGHTHIYNLVKSLELTKVAKRLGCQESVKAISQPAKGVIMIQSH